MLVGQVVADRFTLLRRAGRGGMGTVFEADDRVTGIRVALKLVSALDEGLAARFDREARVLASFDDETIVRYLDHGALPSGDRYLAMEWLGGHDLASYLQQQELSVRETIELGRRIGRALGTLHRHGVVHRDVKPANLFLVDDDVTKVKLVDFGVVHLRDAQMQMTQIGDRIGTPRYMSPEQVRGELALDGRADVFALGCVLYRCLTGRDAFDADSEVAVLARILLEHPAPPRQLRAALPAALDAILGRMLAKQKSDRPNDGVAVAALLEGLGPLDERADETPAGPATVVLSRRALGEERHSASLALVQHRGGEADDAALAAIAARHGLRFERAGQRSFVLSHTGSGVVRDMAMRAARAALAVVEALPHASASVATGLADDHRGAAVGEVIDRAASCLADDEPGLVRLDRVTESLLDARFEVATSGSGPVLRGMQDQLQRRTLLGKAAPYVGREREQSLLVGLVRESSEDEVARCALVIAPPGLGKSRLRAELVQQLRRDFDADRLAIWLARGDVLRADVPYGLCAAFVKEALDLRPEQPLEQQIGALRAAVGDPQWVPFLAELIGVTHDPDGRVAAARPDPLALADLVRSAFVKLLDQACETTAVVLVIDDLHWADAPSLRLLDAALGALTERRFVVLGMARPELHDHFPRLFVERGVQELRLTELSKKACERLVKAVLGVGTSPAIVERLVTLCEGNVFFLEELIRHAAEHNEASLLDAALPESVLAMVQFRLQQLSLDERRVLRAAAVFGDRFWLGALVEILGERRETVAAYLNNLQQREIVTRRQQSRFVGEEELTFRHALVREGAYATLTAEDRAHAHRGAAAWLTNHGEVDAVVLGHHFEAGGEPSRAAVHFLAAAQQNAEANDLARARALAEHGLRLDATARERARLHLLLTEIGSWLGDWSMSEQHARATLADSGDDASLFYDVAPLLVLAAAQVGHEGDALDVARRLAERLTPVEITLSEAVAAARAAAPLLLRGHVTLAGTLIARFADQVETLAGPGTREQAFLIDALALQALLLGNLPAARRWKQLEVECFRALGQIRHEALQRVWLGYTALECGDYPFAIIELEQALVQGERMQLGRVVALAKHNLGIALARRDPRAPTDVEQGAHFEREAVALFDAQKDVRLSAGARCYLSEIQLYLGDRTGALQSAEEAVALAPGSSPAAAGAQAARARALLALDQNEEARRAAESGLAILQSIGGTDEGEILIYLAVAEARRRTGDAESARAALQSAQETLAARSLHFVEGASRAAFLAIPIHAELLAAL